MDTINYSLVLVLLYAAIAVADEPSVNQFDWESYIESQNLPSADDLLATLGHDTSLDEIFDRCSDIPAYPPLSEDVNKKLAAFKEKRQDYARQGRFSEAVAIAKQELELRRAHQEDSHWEVRHAIQTLAEVDHVSRLSESAQQELAQAEQLFVPMYQALGSKRYEEARQATLQQLKLRARHLGIDHPWSRISISWLGTLALYEWRSAEAEEIFRYLIAQGRSTHARNYANQVKLLGNSHKQLGNYYSALAFQSKALELLQELDGCDTMAVALHLRQLAMVLNHVNSQDAANVARQATDIVIRIQGSASPELPPYYATMAAIEQKQFNYRLAEAYHRRAYELNKTHKGTTDQSTVTSINNIATVLHAQGDYEGASELFEQAAELNRQRWGEEHPVYVFGCGALAELRFDQGRYGEARDLFEQELAFVSKQYGHDHYYSLRSRLGLARLALATSIDIDGESYARQALDLQVQKHGQGHRYAIGALQVLALNILETGRADAVAEADALIKKAYDIAIATDAPEQLAVLVKHADRLHASGDQEQAVAVYEQAIEVQERQRQQVHGDELDRSRYASVLTKLGAYGKLWRVLMAQGRAAEGLAYLERGRGRGLLDLLNRSDENLSQLLKEYAESRGQTELSAKITRLIASERNTRENVFVLTKKIEGVQKDQTLGSQERQSQIDSLAEQMTDARENLRLVVRQSYELARDRLGNGLQPFDARQIQASLAHDELILMYEVSADDAWVILIGAAGPVVSHRLHWADGSRVSSPDLKRSIDELYDKADGTPHVQMAEFGDALVPSDVRQHLQSARRVLVVPHGPLFRLPLEMLSFSDGSNWIDQYPATTYNPSCTVALLGRVSESSTPGSKTTLVALGDPVFERTGAPIPNDGLLVEGVPENSVLDLRPGDVLVSWDGTSLTHAGMLPSASAHVGGPEADPGNLIVWREGALVTVTASRSHWGLTLSELPMPEAYEQYKLKIWSSESASTHLAYRDALGTWESLPALPGSRVEVRAIADIIQQSQSGADTHVLLGEQATKTRLFDLAGGARFLHLATHGLIRGGRSVYDSALATSKPVVPTVDDYGFLTLGELLADWQGQLNGTELVTLSACQTALGKEEAGEGFIALTWGFMFAGAQSVVASLWRVEDVSTAILMSHFYAKLLADGMAKSQALFEAKRALRQMTYRQIIEWSEAQGLRPQELQQIKRRAELAGLESMPYRAPHYWAGFILVGDAR